MRDSDPTPSEMDFFRSLSELVTGLHDWYHADDDGTPWMVASYDFVANDAIHATLRADYDGRSLRGGWSPACLNWDDGVRAADALIDTTPPEGLHLDNIAPHDAAAAAAAWFTMHISRGGPASLRQG
ncbi:hypothetical protein [Micromonospora sp. 067-2]|uniref:hypothetical protein n=1 Tax=Micromonospora sp. 067-2 TaxID=2789270 RepID=UPI00397A07F8